ncbi:MAG: hypothetical protein ABR558_09680, partial [Thioalkalivibrio sp.]
LSKEAAQLRGRIDRRACRIRLRIDSLIDRVRALVRSPFALPIAFVSGMVAGRLHVSNIKWASGLLVGLASRVKAMQMATHLIGSAVR